MMLDQKAHLGQYFPELEAEINANTCPVFVFLLFIGALAFGSMVALVVLVEPNQNEVTVRIQTRDLLGS